MKRKLKGWKKADRFYILNMQRGNAFTKEEDTFQMKMDWKMDSCRLNTTILPSANKSAGGKIIYEETVTNSV